MHLAQTIRKYLGWCSQPRTVSRRLQVLHDTVTNGPPAQESGMPAHTRWLQRYRNQVLLWAVFFTLVAVPLAWNFQADDFTTLMLYIGMIAGLVIFAYFGRWLWNSFQMLEKGLTIKTGPVEYIILFLIAGGIPGILILIILLITALVGLIPLTVSLAFPAFATGFAFIPWYVFILILVWERNAGCQLMFDKKTRVFTAVRCYVYALH
jgi:hypothetical protein